MFTFHEMHNAPASSSLNSADRLGVDQMTRKELIEENKALREALHAIADQVDDALGIEAEESFDEGEE